MRGDRTSASAIVAGSLTAIVTMALHPFGGMLGDDQAHLERIAGVASAVHVLGIAAIAVQAFGLLGLARALGRDGALVRAGLVAFVIGWGAAMGAAFVSGIVGADLVRAWPGLDPDEQAAMRAIWRYNFIVNQALARFTVAGFSVGIGSWSAVMLRAGRGWRTAGAVGLVVGAAGLVAVLGGLMTMNVAQFGAWIGGVSLWAIAAAIPLWSGARRA